MIKPSTYKIITAWLLLLLFVFSITPKHYLHHLFADHQDECLHNTTNQKQVETAKIDCDTDREVVTDFFEPASAVLFSYPLHHIAKYYLLTPSPRVGAFRYLFPLKGPPSL